MKKKKAYKVKGTNLKQGKKVDNTKLAERKGFARTKEEIQPETKWISQPSSMSKEPKTVRNFVDMLEEKKNEDLGLY